MKKHNRTLIIPDVHEEMEMLEDAIKKYGNDVDSIVVLGDYFDSFNNDGYPTPETTAMIKWVKEHAYDPKYKLLLGNHDLHYGFPTVHGIRCSGYNIQRQELIKKGLNRNDWNQLKLHCWVDGWLLSHAGLHYSFSHALDGISPQHIDKICAKALERLNNCISDELIEAGEARGGRRLWGGITWLDWNQEFKPIPGLNQIVGHTKGYLPMRTKEGPDSTNYCIDNGCQHVGILEDGKLQVLPILI